MKIVFTIDSLARGGKERQLCVLFSNLNSDIDKSIWLKNYSSSNNYLKEYNINQKTILKYDGISDFYHLIKKEKPDIIFTWDAISSFYALLFQSFYKYKLINGSIRHGIRLKKASHLFRSLIAWLSPIVIANSFAGLKANNIKPGKRNIVLYNGVDPKFNASIENFDKTIILKKMFPSFDRVKEIVFVSVANFSPYKDYFSVLKVLSEIQNKIPFRYLIIGDGPLRKEIEKKIINYNLAENITLLGAVDNVGDYLKLGDIMIHSSKGEGISNAILEGMHSGLPIIASNVGGIPETIFPEYSLLFDYTNTKQLKDHLLNSRSLIDKFDYKNDLYTKHLNQFSVKTMVSNFNDIIKKITKSENL